MWNLGTHYAVFLYSWNTLKNFVVYNEQAFGFYCIVKWQALEKRFHHFICHTKSENSTNSLLSVKLVPFISNITSYVFLLHLRTVLPSISACTETLAIDHSLVFRGQYVSIKFLYVVRRAWMPPNSTINISINISLFFFNDFTVRNCSWILKG